MARPIVLCNGELHVGINKFGLVHDFYFPYVGLENHAAGKSLRHHVGVWVDGKLSWLDGGDWTFDFSYPHHALIGHTVAKNTSLGIMLEFDDMVDTSFSAFVRTIHLVNLTDTSHDVRLFLHQAFVVGDSRSKTDTAQYLPEDNAILHYRGRRALIVSAKDEHGGWFDQYTVGLFGIEGYDGTYRDAEDGELSFCPVEHGRVDSTLRFKADLAAHSSIRFDYWIAAGTSPREALYIHKQLQKQGVAACFDRSADWWHKWLAPATAMAEKIDRPYRENFIQSVMLIKSQIDKHGAVIASTDTAMLNYSRDAYAYCWPRDGAYALWPLIRLGYQDEPHKFFEFCRRGLQTGGYLAHKYRADGAIGSSWHPYIHEDGVVAPPIQEDETALVLFVFSQFYHMHSDPKLLKEFYESMVVKMADFLAGYVDLQTGLPKPSYDLWEQVFMTTTYTTSITYAALEAAADLADSINDSNHAVSWRAAASDIQTAAHKHLYNPDRKTFYKGFTTKNGEIVHDDAIDVSSTFGAFMFGLFSTDSVEIKSSIATILKTFKVGKKNPGLPRYEHDNYYGVDPKAEGELWFITSLWLAQYYIEDGKIDEAKNIIDWVSDRAMPTGVLPERINPLDFSSISVAPLTWSQAEYVATLLDLTAGG